MDKPKQIKNLFKKLTKDENSIFYATGRITRILLSKARESLHEKDEVFYKYYLDSQDKNMLYENNNTKTRTPFYTPFVGQKKDIDQFSALYSTKGLFNLVHASMLEIRFFSKSAINPKYCLLVVDVFTSKMFVCPMKSRNLLARKLELFYQDILPEKNEIKH